jgi:hypothetical protein
MDWLYWALFFAAAFAALVFAVLRDGGLRTSEPEPARARRKTPAPIDLPRSEPIEVPAADPKLGPDETEEGETPEAVAGETSEVGVEPSASDPAAPESEGERNT